MSFRKRQVTLNQTSTSSSHYKPSLIQKNDDWNDRDASPAGIRPSPFDGRLVTSTGTGSLDAILAGHAGLPLGCTLLIEERGTTDFGGILLKYFATQGLVSGQHVHLLGLGEDWCKSLPGLADAAKSTHSALGEGDRMKIAWRYAAFGGETGPSAESKSSVDVTIDSAGQGPGKAEAGLTGPTLTHTSPYTQASFCSSFDLKNRLDKTAIRGHIHTYRSEEASPASILTGFLAKLARTLSSSPPTSIHRVLIPSILNPSLYHPATCRPGQVLQFFHGFRALTRQYPNQIVVMATLPLALHPRSSGFVRWLEVLSDCVLELVAMPHSSGDLRSSSDEVRTQGIVRAHSLPGYHERGGGMDDIWERRDMLFKLSTSSGFTILPFTLPPVDTPSSPSEEKQERLDF